MMATYRPSRVEERAELVEPVVLQQLARVARADSRSPRPNGASGDSRAFSAGATRRSVASTAAPPVGGVDVGAVREVKRRIGAQQHTSNLCSIAPRR